MPVMAVMLSVAVSAAPPAEKRILPFSPVAERAADGLEIRYAKLPVASPFTTEADFALPFESNIKTLPAAPGTPAKAPARAVNLPLTLPTFNFMPLYDTNWTSGYDFSLCSFDPNTGTVTKLAGGDSFYGADLGIKAGNTIYTSVPLSNGATYRFSVSATDFSVTSTTVNNNKVQALSAAYDETSSTIYICRLTDDKSSFVFTTFDPATGTPGAVIADWGTEGLSAMGITRQGQLVGVSNSGNFYTVDKATGTRTLVKAYSDMAASYNCSGCCDLSRNIFYYAYFGGVGTSVLYAFDIESGERQSICTIPRSIEAQGLYIAAAPFDASMPADPKDLEVSFTDDSLMGTVSFTMPATTYDGTVPPADARVTYQVFFNGQLTLSGETPYGEHVSLPVTVASRGQYNVELKVSNEAGFGDALTHDLYIGYDDMTDIATVTMNMSDTQFDVSWTPVTPVHGGFYRPSDISYDVVRYPDGLKVAEGTTANSVVVPIASDLPDGVYSFGVTAHFYNPDTKAPDTKAEVLSGARVRGAYNVPFTYTLDNPREAYQIFTSENANRDGASWAFSTGGAIMQYNDSDPTIGMDDWLFSMPVRLYAGNIYTVKIGAFAGNGQYPERFNVKAGTGASSGEMTIDVIPATVVTDNITATGSFIVPADGIYYIGIHACSDPDTYYLGIGSIAMEVAGTSAAPGMPTDLSLQAVYEGNLEQAHITFKAPDVTAEGKTLQSIDRIDIMRNGDVVTSISSPAPGSAQEFLDNITVRGTQQYQIQAYNAAGAGMPAAGSVFVGYAATEGVKKINTAIVPDQDNTVKLWWDPITHDLNGRYINRTMWYQPNVIFPNTAQSTAGNGIYSSPGFTHADIHLKYAQLNADYDAEKNDQFFVRYYLSNYYYEGTGLWEGPTHGGTTIPFSEYVPVGKPYTLPMAESFADGATHYEMFLTDHGTDGDFTIAKQTSTPSAQAYDEDGYMLVFRPKYIGDRATLITGRVSFSETVIPRLTFYYYAVPGSNDMIRIGAGLSSDDMATLASFRVGETGLNCWQKASVDLSKYRNSTVLIGIGAECVSGTGLVLIDKIEITDPDEDNLAVGEIQTVGAARAGRELTLTSTVTNNGHNDMGAYTATLTANGEAAGTFTGKALAQGETEQAAFRFMPAVTHDEGITFVITVEAAGDANPDDNTASAKVEVSMPGYPAVTDLAAEISDETDVTLSWTRPSGIGDVAEITTDGVESYVAFSTGLPGSELGENDYIGAWSTVDADRQPTTQIANTDFANNRGTGGSSSPKAWMVFNIDKANVSAAYREGLTPHAGSQCFICPAADPADDVKGNDDWLISPLLSGRAQTVTFFAKAISDAYGQERFEVLYSTGSLDPADFVSIASASVGAAWQAQSAQLPEGALRFAVRCVSYDAWALLVDDITYEAGADVSLQLAGYNVYRDKKLLSAEPQQEGTFSDPGLEKNVYSYHVTAVYNLGESALSNKAVADLVAAGADTATVTGVTASVHGCTITVSGADGLRVAIAAADGKVIAVETGRPSGNSFTVAPGVYLVSAGRTTFKLLARR